MKRNRSHALAYTVSYGIFSRHVEKHASCMMYVRMKMEALQRSSSLRARQLDLWCWSASSSSSALYADDAVRARSHTPSL